MKKIIMNITNRLPLYILTILIFGGLTKIIPQEIKWLRVADLQSFVTEIGAEYENQLTTGNLNYFSWPAKYGIGQNTQRARALWIGAKNFNDPVEGK